MPQMPQVPYQMMTNFQIEFMKKMFDEMKELLKTNMMAEQQRMQETLIRNMTMQGMQGTMPGYSMPMMPGMMPGMMIPQNTGVMMPPSYLPSNLT